MGNSCECIRRQSDDEAEDALLASLVGEGADGRPRGPPPPYQPQAPVYNYSLAAMPEERRAQLVRRITIIQSLPCIRYELRGDKDKKKEPRECAICMMDYCAGEPIRLLPCMHYYHLHCIDDWLMRSLTCPMCMERVDTGLMATIRSSGGGSRRNSRGGGSGGNSQGGGGRRGGFSLRRRRGRGQGERGSESPLMSSDVSSSRSSSRSSSTSSSTEHLISPGGQFLWPPTSQRQRSSQVLSSNSGTIFLPPFSPQSPNPTTSQNSNMTRPPSQNSCSGLAPLPRLMSPPSSPTLVLVHSSPPTSPLLPNVTVHTVPPHHSNQIPAN